MDRGTLGIVTQRVRMSSIFNYISESSVQLLLVFTALFTFTYLVYRRLNVSHNGGHKLPPALPSLPIVGSLPFLPTNMKDLAELGISPSNKLGKIFSLRLGPKYVVVISGKKAIHEALVTKSIDFADRPETYQPWALYPPSKGIVLGHYDSTFRSYHQLCLSTLKRFGFGQRVMETRILMEVEEMINKVREEQGRPFDMTQLTTSCVVNIIINMLYGYRFDHSDEAFQQFISFVHEGMTDYSVALEIFPLLRFLPYFRRYINRFVDMCKITTHFIDSNISTCIEKETESFVNYYIEACGPDYDHERLWVTLQDMLAAGMETSSTFIRWATVLLANHVSVQDRLHAEIDSVIGRQRLPTLDDQSRLRYVEAAVLELLRYKTLVPFAITHCTLKDTEVGGYFIPKGTTVLINLYSAHMDPDDWQQPQQFRPERFLDESDNIIDQDRVIAFSLGKRSCLGEQLGRQEIFLFLVALLQNFYFRPPEGQDRIDVREEWGVTNSPSAYKVRMIVRDA